MNTYGESITISQTLTLPKTYVTDVDFVSGIRGSGKSYCVGVIEEEMMKAKWPMIIIDPLGIHYSIRERYNNFVIIGGKYSDGENIGRLIDKCLMNRISCVVDVSEYDEEDQRKICTIVCECIKEYKPGPIKVIIEECDIFVPQRGGDRKCKEAIIWLARKERMFGIGMTLICQRFASVDKNIVTQVENFFLFNTTWNADIRGIKEIVRIKQIDDIVGAKPGNCWLQSPYQRGMVKIKKRMCTHLGTTPVLGETQKLIKLKVLSEKVNSILFEEEKEESFLDRLRNHFS